MGNKVLFHKNYLAKQKSNNTIVSNSMYKSKLAISLGVKYATLVVHLNTNKSIWSPIFKSFLLVYEENTEIINTSINTTYIEKTPISGVELKNLPEKGIIALKEDKVTIHSIFSSPAQAAKILDNKVEFLYISRYINVEYLVNISQGNFYFVKNANYKIPIKQFNLDKKKGVKVPIIMYDSSLDVYVYFPSKAQVSTFLWKTSNRSSALERYLHRDINKPIISFKKELFFYYIKELPKKRKIIKLENYFNLIGRSYYLDLKNRELI